MLIELTTFVAPHHLWACGGYPMKESGWLFMEAMFVFILSLHFCHASAFVRGKSILFSKDHMISLGWVAKSL